MISFTDFSTRPVDVVSFYDGHTPTKFKIRTDIMSESGINASLPLSCIYFPSRIHKMYATFNPLSAMSASHLVPSAGFRVIIKPISLDPLTHRFSQPQRCGGSYINSTGVLSFPSKTKGKLHVSGDCNWHIQVEEGSQVNLTVNNMGGPIADIYSLEIFEGENASDDANFLASVRDFSSFSGPFFVVSKTNKITVILKERIPAHTRCRSRGYPNLGLLYVSTISSTFGCYGRMNLNTQQLSPLPTLQNRQKRYVPSSLRCKWRIGETSIASVGDTITGN